MKAAFSYALAIPVIFLNNPANQGCGLDCISVASDCLNGDVTRVDNAIGRALGKLSS